MVAIFTARPSPEMSIVLLDVVMAGELPSGGADVAILGTAEPALVMEAVSDETACERVAKSAELSDATAILDT